MVPVHMPSVKTMKSQVTYNRKLSGSVFLMLRILSDILILISTLSGLYGVEFNLLSVLFNLMTFLDIFMSLCLLLFPTLTCVGNSYLKCLPFVINGYFCNIIVYHLKIKDLPPDTEDKRIPYIAVLNILTLLMYGGLASPLNMAWMETFKPFSIVVLKGRRMSVDPQIAEKKSSKYF